MNENRPRQILNGIGEMSDVAIKRKIRDRLIDAGGKKDSGLEILFQSDYRKTDDFASVEERAKKLIGSLKTEKEMTEAACKKWFDVRAFGQLFAYSAKKGGAKSEGSESASVSFGVRGPVTIQPAFSLRPISVVDSNIAQSANGVNSKKENGRSSSRLGMKYRVENATYVFFGSIFPQLAEKTGFSEEDANEIKRALTVLFEGDASSARPGGSMAVRNVVWWKHHADNQDKECKLGACSSHKLFTPVQKLLLQNEDAVIDKSTVERLLPNEVKGRIAVEVIAGF